MVELVGVLFQNRKQAFTFVPPHTIKQKFVIHFEIDFDHSYTKVGIIYEQSCYRASFLVIHFILSSILLKHFFSFFLIVVLKIYTMEYIDLFNL